MDHEALLHTLLHELKDSVIVCEADARIIIFNRAAEYLFNRSHLLRRGNSLYNLCCPGPVDQALQLLDFQHGLNSQTEPLPFIQFMNTSIDLEQYFRCRVSFLAPMTDASDGFVIIFEDISAWYTPDHPLFMKVEEFRAPMTNLRAAVENLTEYPEMSPVMRSAFENVLVQETLNLTEAFDALARSCNVVMQTQNNLAELDTGLLFGYVSRHLGSRKISVMASPLQEIKVKVDIYGLLLLLDYLVKKLGLKQEDNQLSCKAHIGEQFIYFDFIWPGELIPTGKVEAMLEEKPDESLGRMSIGAILHSMDGDIWSQQLENNKSMLRLALPKAIKHNT